MAVMTSVPTAEFSTVTQPCASVFVSMTLQAPLALRPLCSATRVRMSGQDVIFVPGDGLRFSNGTSTSY